VSSPGSRMSGYSRLDPGFLILSRMDFRLQPEEEMAKAIWNGKVIAESDTVETVEGNVYFPESSVKREYLRPSSTTSTCPWKGQARYYTLFVDGQENQDAAWYYPDPKPAAKKIKHHIAFWRGVEIESSESQGADS
jgi:uncharacterized protein (DUF427 family)